MVLEEVALCIYVGKSIDTFEDVWNMWMKCAGVLQYTNAEVLSFRCFAFSYDGDVRRWFSPIQTIDKAIVELCINLGIEKMCSIIPAVEWSKQMPELKWPVLLTDVYLDIQGASAREKFYSGNSSFSLLFMHHNKKQMFCSSSGIPFMEISKEQVKESLSKSNGFVIVRNMPLKIQMSSAREILYKGIQWRKSVIYDEYNLEQLCLENFRKVQNRKVQLSLQYGLMNYQIQLSKIVRFCAQELKISNCIIEKLNHILLKIFQVNRSCIYEEIMQIEKEFWMEIEKIEENCHV